MANSYICVNCGKIFANRHNLSRHKKTCKGDGNHIGSEAFYSINPNRPRVRFLAEKPENLHYKSHNDDMSKYVREPDNEVDDSSA